METLTPENLELVPLVYSGSNSSSELPSSGGKVVVSYNLRIVRDIFGSGTKANNKFSSHLLKHCLNLGV